MKKNPIKKIVWHILAPPGQRGQRQSELFYNFYLVSSQWKPDYWGSLTVENLIKSLLQYWSIDNSIIKLNVW